MAAKAARVCTGSIPLTEVHTLTARLEMLCSRSHETAVESLGHHLRGGTPASLAICVSGAKARRACSGRCRGVSQKAGVVGVRLGGVDRSGQWKLDVLEREDFGELVEVGVAMEQRNATVFSSGRGDQRVG
jgi:hypothetical protein